MSPEECLRRYRRHNWTVRPGGARQRNPYNGKLTTLRTQLCSRCGTSEMFFDDDLDEESSSEGESGGGFKCPNCGEVGRHADWCPYA